MDRTKCEVELALDEFALEEVERVAGRLGVPRGRVVQRAVRHWLDEESAGRLAAGPLPRGRQISPHPAVALAVDLEPSDWEAVRRVAEAREIEAESLVCQAVVLLLADVDAGRVAADVARSANAAEPRRRAS